MAMRETVGCSWMCDLMPGTTPPPNPNQCTASSHLVWYRTGLRCSAASKTLNNVVMTMRL